VKNGTHHHARREEILLAFIVSRAAAPARKIMRRHGFRIGQQARCCGFAHSIWPHNSAPASFTKKKWWDLPQVSRPGT